MPWDLEFKPLCVREVMTNCCSTQPLTSKLKTNSASVTIFCHLVHNSFTIWPKWCLLTLSRFVCLCCITWAEFLTVQFENQLRAWANNRLIRYTDGYSFKDLSNCVAFHLLSILQLVSHVWCQLKGWFHCHYTQSSSSVSKVFGLFSLKAWSLMTHLYSHWGTLQREWKLIYLDSGFMTVTIAFSVKGILTEVFWMSVLFILIEAIVVYLSQLFTTFRYMNRAH